MAGRRAQHPHRAPACAFFGQPRPRSFDQFDGGARGSKGLSIEHQAAESPLDGGLIEGAQRCSGSGHAVSVRVLDNESPLWTRPAKHSGTEERAGQIILSPRKEQPAYFIGRFSSPSVTASQATEKSA